MISIVSSSNSHKCHIAIDGEIVCGVSITYEIDVIKQDIRLTEEDTEEVNCRACKSFVDKNLIKDEEDSLSWND